MNLSWCTVAFYKEKQMSLTGSEADYAHAAKISPAEGQRIYFRPWLELRLILITSYP